MHTVQCFVAGLVVALFLGISSAAPEPGERVPLDSLDVANVPLMPVRIEPADAPTLILSDKPEYFRTGNGVALDETLQPGPHTLYLYHVPTPGDAKHVISVVVDNLANEPATLRFDKSLTPTPGGDYHRIAREQILNMIGGESQPRELHIEPLGRAVFDAQLEQRPAGQDELVHAWYRFELDRPVRLRVFQRDIDADSLKVVDSLPALPRVLEGFHASGAGRGVFERPGRVVVPVGDPYDTAAGAMQIQVADGEGDAWIVGRDSIAGDEPQNKGNYGVIYTFRIPYRSGDGRAVGLYVYNARAAGQWCRYSTGGVRVGDVVVPLPRDDRRFDGLNEAVFIARFDPPPAGETGTIEFTWTPPGACCLPTPFVLKPID